MTFAGITFLLINTINKPKIRAYANYIGLLATIFCIILVCIPTENWVDKTMFTKNTVVDQCKNKPKKVIKYVKAHKFKK